MKYALIKSSNFRRLESANFDNFNLAVWNKLIVCSLIVVRTLLNEISQILTLGREIVFTITRIIYRHAHVSKFLYIQSTPVDYRKGITLS